MQIRRIATVARKKYTFNLATTRNEELAANPALPADILQQAVPGNLRRADTFVRFLRRLVAHLRKRMAVESVVQAGGPAGKMGAGCRGCWPKRTGAGAAPIAGFAPKAGVALNNPAGAGAGVAPRPKAALAASTFA